MSANQDGPGANEPLSRPTDADLRDLLERLERPRPARSVPIDVFFEVEWISGLGAWLDALWRARLLRSVQTSIQRIGPPPYSLEEVQRLFGTAFGETPPRRDGEEDGATGRGGSTDEGEPDGDGPADAPPHS